MNTLSNLKKIEWSNSRKGIDEIFPANYNPRKITDEQAAQLKESLDKFQLADPIIINTDNKIIGGHQRYYILKQSGETQVDVRVPDRALTDDEERELNLRLNKNTGEWNLDLLKDFDKDLLADVGFTSAELDAIFPIEASEQDDVVPEPPDEPITQRGDIWQLGRHRVMCGDSTNSGDVALLMDGKKADMVFTDPPYNVQIDYGTHKDDYSESEHIEFSKAWFGLARSYSNQVLFTSGFGRGMGMPNIKMWYSIYPPDWMIIWVKKNAVVHSSLGGFNNWEPILFYGKAKKKLPQDIFDVPITVQNDVADKKGNKLHPTPKSRKLWTEVIEKLTDRDDVLYEPFSGSGTTLIACEQTSRICYGMEIDTKYVDVIIKRWEDFTGQKAELSNGKNGAKRADEIYAGFS